MYPILSLTLSKGLLCITMCAGERVHRKSVEYFRLHYNGQRPKKRLSASLVMRKNKCPIAGGVSGCIPQRICVND